LTENSNSLAPLDLDVTIPQNLKVINGVSPVDASILESMGSVPPVAFEVPSGSTPPAGTTAATIPSEVSAITEAAVDVTDPVPAVPTTEYYDDEHLSPGEADDTEDGFLESEVFQNLHTETFDTSTLCFFRALFSDRSEFIRKYHEKRGDKEISIPKWTNSPQFGMIRNVQYYAPVKVPLGPDKTRVQETQRYVLQKSRLLIETISIMFDIPYGDSFRLETKILVSSPSATAKSCSLQISMCVHFVKKTWFKGRIESQSLKEMKESFRQWIDLAREEFAIPGVIERISGPVPQLLPKSAPATPQVAPKDIPSTSIPVSSTSNTALPSQPSAATISASSGSSTASVLKESILPEQRPVSMVTKDARASAKAIKKLPATPPYDEKSLSIYGVTVPLPSLDQQTVLMMLVVFLSLFCIYLYCKISYLEGKFSVVENLLIKQIFDRHP